jgi:hypothetical protein
MSQMAGAQARKPVQSPPARASGTLQRKCDRCRENKPVLQRSAVGSPLEMLPPMGHDLHSPEAPDSATPAFMEPHFGQDFCQVPVHSRSRASIQAKLKVNTPGDLYEQEADRVADQVLAMPVHAVNGAPPHIQRFSGQPSGQAETAPASVDRALASPGSPLEPALREDMEQRFGQDFSHVRVHSGAAAEQSAKDVNAHAYTMVHDIVFGAGQLAPGTHEGRRLIAHELTHVVQQRGTRSDIPQVQRKVVDDDAHLPCRAVPGRSAAELTVPENNAAMVAESAAAAVRANPLAEPIRALIWKRFRLDYNDPLTRCRFLPEIGDRFARIAREIRNTDCTYSCTATGEPHSRCTTPNKAAAVTLLGWFNRGTNRIALCSEFWKLGPNGQAAILLHEWAHNLFATRGLFDEIPGGFDTAGCYHGFAMELGILPMTPFDRRIIEHNCISNVNALPALDRGRLHLKCQANVFLNLSALGGYAYGLPGSKNYLTAGLGLDYLFPLTRMHDWELAVGARYLRFAPTDSSDRNDYLLGVRAALAFRYRPWRFGWQLGPYIESGGINVPAEGTGTQTRPYGAAGVSGGLNLRIGRQAALQILGEIGGGVSFDTQNDRRFGWFQSGLSIVFQFQ